MMKENYLNNTVWCRLGPSKLGGIGVIAIRKILKGTVLTDYTINDALNGKKPIIFRFEAIEFDQLKPEIKDIILDRMTHIKGQTNIFISPNFDQVLRSFMNHSYDPNSDGVVALKDIEQGEEVTENYFTMADMPGREVHEVSMNHYKKWLK